MAHRARRLGLLGLVAVWGCAAGVIEPQANSLRLVSDSVGSAPAATADDTAAPSDDSAEPVPPPADGKISVTVEGPPQQDAESTDAVESPVVDDPPPADEEAADEVLAPAEVLPDDLPRGEPEAAVTVSDEPLVADTKPSPLVGEGGPGAPGPGEGAEVLKLLPVADKPPAAPEVIETIAQPLSASDAERLTAEDQEEVATPRPLAASPFKSGTDESDLDRFNRPLTDVPIDIRPTEGDLPADLAAARVAGEPTIDETWPGETWSDGDAPPDIFCTYTPWTICYRPLYFEDIPLERYGCNVGYLQSGLSGAKFFASIAALPYKMTVRPPRSCECSNGFSRCGDCPLPGYGRREFRVDASLIEAAAVAGVVYILP